MLEALNFGVPLDRARVVCVLVHGRGQTPEEMVETVVGHLTAPGVAYVLPRAKSKSWYDARAVDPLTDQTRAQVAQSLAELGQVMAQAQKSGLPVLLAGFSQGACLALEHALASGPWPGALVAFTGCRVGAVGDERPNMPLNGLPVYLTGGDGDPWIPVTGFAEAAAALGLAHARLRADLFSGRGHEVCPQELRVLDGVLRDLAQGKPVTWESSR